MPHSEKILSIGRQILSPDVLYATPKDFPSLYDFDIVLIDLNDIGSFYQGAYSSDPNKFWLSSESTSEFIRNILRLQRDLSEFVNDGGVAFIFSPLEKMIAYLSDGDIGLPNTARNRNGYVDVKFTDLLHPIIVNTYEAKGNKMEAVPGSELRAFYDRLRDYLSYNVYLESYESKPLLKIQGTQKSVSLLVQRGQGLLFFIPDFSSDGSTADQIFVECLRQTLQRLKPQDEMPSIPEWAESFEFSKEIEIRCDLTDMTRRLEEARNQITEMEREIEFFRQMKRLISDTGETLENQIAKLFEELGFQVNKGEDGREDLIIQKDNKVAVVEIKGVGKSAAEKHAAQLEKWVANYLEQNEVNPKGILIVNAFNNTPLDARHEKAFPDQMLPYSTARSHCLLTSTQLLGIWNRSRENPDETNILIDKIFDTVGVFEDFTNYNQFLLSSNSTPIN